MRIGNSLTAKLYSEPNQVAGRKLPPATKSITQVGMKVFVEEPSDNDDTFDHSKELENKFLCDDAPEGVACTIM